MGLVCFDIMAVLCFLSRALGCIVCSCNLELLMQHPQLQCGRGLLLVDLDGQLIQSQVFAQNAPGGYRLWASGLQAGMRAPFRENRCKAERDAPAYGCNRR